jgi:hypothetical protein
MNHFGEIKKMSGKFKKKSVLTPRNVREKSNTVIYYKTPTLTNKRREIKKILLIIVLDKKTFRHES